MKKTLSNRYEKDRGADTDAKTTFICTILNQKTARALTGGGDARMAKQHAAGKLSVRDRIDKLLDPAVIFY